MYKISENLTQDEKPVTRDKSLKKLPKHITPTGAFHEKKDKNKKDLLWLVLGIVGMLLVSPSIALVTLIILAGWLCFGIGRGQISWWMILGTAIIFLFGLFILSSALTRGNLSGDSPLAVINNFVRESLKWNVYKVEEESGWVQKLFLCFFV